MAYHALQYTDLYVVEDSFDGIIDQIDTESLGNHIHFGPQADVCEKLEHFNTNWNGNLEITKTFKWKRGTYQKVAELVNNCLGFNRKPSGMYNFLSREEYFRRHRWAGLQDELRSVDRLLCNLRYDGELWLEDPSILTERKDIYSNYLSEQMDNMHNLGGNIPQYIATQNMLQIAPNCSSNKKYRLVTTMTLSPRNIKVYHTNGRASDVAAREIQEIPCNLELDINIITYPLYDMIRNLSYDSPSFNTKIQGNVAPFSNVGKIEFPYISRPYYRDEFGGSVCFGDEATNINRSIRSMDMTSLILHLTNWCQSYTTSTTPHYNIKMMFNGMPSYINEEFKQAFGNNRSRDCNYEIEDFYKEETYCDISGCTLRDTCTQYKTSFPVPITEVPVELVAQTNEQMTLQWATRMGGNPVTHVANNPDNPMQEQGVLTDETYVRYQRDLVETPEPTNEEE